MRKTLVENENVQIYLEQGMLCALYRDLYVNLDIVKKLVNERLEVSCGKKYPILINIKPVKNVCQEARNFLASEQGCEGVTAAAILIDSVLTSMIANFFLRVNKPLVPTRLFTDEDEAKQWLRQFVK